jgi:hypothetical protein
MAMLDNVIIRRICSQYTKSNVAGAARVTALLFGTSLHDPIYYVQGLYCVCEVVYLVCKSCGTLVPYN